MASWLASQLKAAETLLEAVDRTVSSATAAAGQATRPLEQGAQKQATGPGDGYVIKQHTTGPFIASPTITSQQSTTSPSLGSGSYQHSLAQPVNGPFASTNGSSSPAMAAAAAVSGPPPPLFQQRPWQPGSPAVNQAHISSPPAAASPLAYAATERPDATTLPQPSSTGSYTVRYHGPFSPSPVEQDLPQSVQQPALTGSSWNPTTPAAAGGAGAVPAPSAAPLGSQAVAGSPSAQRGSIGPVLPAAAAGSGQNSKLDQTSASADACTSAESNSAGGRGAFSGIGRLDADRAVQAAAEQQQQEMHDEQGSGSTTAHAAVLPSSVEQPHMHGSAALVGTWQPPADIVGPAAAGPAETAAAADSATGLTPAAEEAAVEAANAGSQQQHQGFAPAAASAAITAAVAAAAAQQEHQHHTPEPPPPQQQQPALQDHNPASSSNVGPPPPAANPGSAAAAPGLTQSISGDDDAVSASPAASASSGAVAKEAQLTRLVETLRKRLDRVKAENQQLEDLLHSAEQRTAAEQQRAEQAAAEVAALHRAQDDLITSAAANAAAQDARIGRLQQDLEASNRQVAALQDALEAIQEQHQQVLSSKDSIEGGALEALRSELFRAETQLEAERKAHASTKAAATARERDLEEQLGSSSEALAATQRQFQELAGRSRDLEEQHALAAAEAARLQQQLQQLEGEQIAARQPDPAERLRLEAEKEALGVQLAEAQGALLAAHQAQRAAESQVANLQQELVQLQNNMQASATRGAPQLEQQVAELQELLYQKQQQLERLSGEKQGQVMMLERQVNMLRQELGKAHAAAAAANTSSSGRAAHDIIPMDALGEPYQRLARHRKLGGAVQATANFLDTTAATATQLLRQQPLARLAVFVYLILIHLYVYFLLARMQRQAMLLLAAQDKASGDLGAQLQEPGPGALPH